MSSHHPEVLAPAGDEAALRAALSAGADAVYFGLSQGFNARARASNFAAGSLAETVLQCHEAGARVYLTLNTLIFEDELVQAADAIREAARSGVDALIVQDPAVALLARRLAPTLELHASTQMTVSSAEGARFAADLGISRVVVPRELSVSEIQRMARDCSLELEVFVHGALCVSWSGQCLTSEAWSGRSANRGQCAQSCRMPYDLVLDNELRHDEDLAYLLSPRDLAGFGALPDLVAAGIHGLKIEGRQKSPQYVATATAGYRAWVDALIADPAAKKQLLSELPQQLRDLSVSYSRGFSEGFLSGINHQTLVEGRFPKHRGLLLGRVEDVFGDAVTVLPETRPHELSAAPDDVEPGQGVVFDQGNPEDKNEPGGPVFRVEHRHGRLRLGFGQPGPDLDRVRPGDRVWITSDPRLAREQRRHIEGDEPRGRNAIRLCVVGTEGHPLEVTVRNAGDETVEARSESSLSPARGRGLDAKVLSEKLGAFGATPYQVSDLNLDGLAPGLHLPVSELKALRRQLTEGLNVHLRARSHAVYEGDLRSLVEELRPARAQPSSADEPRVIPLIRSMDQLEAVIDCGIPEVEIDWMELVGLSKAVVRAREAGLVTTIASLRVQKPGEDGFGSALEQQSPDGVLVRHWGALERFKSAPPSGERPLLHGDFSLNVTNTITAAHLLRSGLDTITASHDLDGARLLALAEGVEPGSLTVVVHHRIATFHTEHCVYAHLLSEGRDHTSCGRPCEEHEIALRDHHGLDHPVIVDAGCRNTVFNGERQTGARLVPELLARGVRRFRVEFVRESRDEARLALESWQTLLAGQLDAQGLEQRLATIDRVGVIGTAD